LDGVVVQADTRAAARTTSAVVLDLMLRSLNSPADRDASRVAGTIML